MLQIPAHVNVGFVVGRLFFWSYFSGEVARTFEKAGCGVKVFLAFCGEAWLKRYFGSCNGSGVGVRTPVA
jgi:hypothetical protein